MFEARHKKQVDDLKQVVYNDRHRSAGRIDRQQFRMVDGNRAAVGKMYVERLEGGCSVELTNSVNSHNN
jgi:hypothetical protein